MLMLVMRDLRVRNMQLNEARAELARLAVAEERERFARDLHDLLGHSLSVIALKAELARRMLADGPHDAANEVAELEQVARTALTEVREAVSGYRQPTLDGELAGARMALSAAGIEADIQYARVPLDPAVEAVLAWAVREGATNVIRHSGARHCTLKISATLTDASVEVIDDGRGARDAGSTAVPAPVGVATSATGVHGAGDAGTTGTTGTPARVRDATTASIPDPAGDATAASIPDPAGDATAASIPDPAGDATAASMRPPAVAANGAHHLGNSRPVDRAGGHGLAGLAERAAFLNGTIEAGTLRGGGYRLVVTVPVSHA
jgi:two-component system sensor histidine kinase DesK